jgi:hypothetical protein
MVSLLLIIRLILIGHVNKLTDGSYFLLYVYLFQSLPLYFTSRKGMSIKCEMLYTITNVAVLLVPGFTYYNSMYSTLRLIGLVLLSPNWKDTELTCEVWL